MFKSKPTMLISCIAALVPLGLYLYLYPQMPVFVPIHYNGETPDRFVDKASMEVILLSVLGWLGFILMKLLRVLLQKMLLSSYMENIAAVHRIWNAATLLVTIGLAATSTFALTEMVW
ncbi:hypothetical protein GCM10010912_31630 [Paenibacillus albidus]|uniref:DUF1648 domain-containing protein n=1 Tax=Paenibacillus albidus TaxID=2041023 RepID=A0A917FJB5_9BACL|nr:DUF1648 domain-containing protein [Paenibacillus albidus]GGF84090.1 hypothetical protein GCM10010912_31630 [Paenibacillus albidus]